jgi:hypothetical protein
MSPYFARERHFLCDDMMKVAALNPAHSAGKRPCDTPTMTDGNQGALTADRANLACDLH